eukprot:253002_1
MAYQPLLRDGKEWDFDEKWISDNRDKQWVPNAQYIGNALVAMVGVSQYIGYHDLPGVQQDVTQNADLWHGFLNYDMNILTDNEQQHRNITLKDAQAFFENIHYAMTKNNYDSLIVVLSGHGEDDSLITADGKGYKLTAIQDMFNAKSLPSYCNKPKLYIVDLCRGHKLASLVDVPEKNVKRWKGHGPRIIHPDSDVNIIYSTTPNYQSLDTETGSVMMPCLSDVIQKTDLTKHHWTNIVTMLSDQVANKCELLCVQSVSTINYLIFFQKRAEQGYLKYFTHDGQQITAASNAKNRWWFAVMLDRIREIQNRIMWNWKRVKSFKNLPKVVVLPPIFITLCCGIFIGFTISRRDSMDMIIPQFAQTFNNSVWFVYGLVIETAQNVYHSNRRRM